ncbi:MAG: hypothetical protein AAGI17_00285 [Planctomycetota bacterium]
MRTPDRVPKPKPDTEPADARVGLTFFLTAQERTAVLRVLRRHHKTRSCALLLALGLEIDERRRAG